MEQPVPSSLDVASGAASSMPPPFVAYTAFPAAEQWLEKHLGPQAKVLLPARHQENYVRFLPWVAVIFLPIKLAAVLLLVGVSMLAALVGSFSPLASALALVVFVLDLIALPGLFGRTRRGWAFFTYALAVNALGNVFSFSLFGLATSTLMFWIAFQVKPRYA
jgi:hypothetical protein